MVSLVIAFVTVAIKGVRPAPDAKVKFVTSVAYGDGYQAADVAARCEIIEVYNEDNFQKIAVYDKSKPGNVKDFYVSKGTYLDKGEVYYIYYPTPGGHAVFRDTSWDWDYITWTFILSAIIGYGVVAFLLVIIGSLIAASQERHLEH